MEDSNVSEILIYIFKNSEISRKEVELGIGNITVNGLNLTYNIKIFHNIQDVPFKFS